MKKVNVLTAFSTMTALSVSMLFSNNVYAAETTILTPTSESTVILDQVEYVEDESGEQTFTISGHGNAIGPNPAPSQDYHISVDPENGTYTTSTIGNSVPDSEVPYQAVSDPYEGVIVEDSALEPETKATYTNYKATVKAVTDDPAGWDLAITKQTLYWIDKGPTISYNGRSLSDWAAYPSQLGTHWYNDEAYFNGSAYLFDYQTRLRSTVYASYHNWDFWDNDKKTTTAHNIIITANSDSTYDYSVTWSKSGEGSYLLDLDVYAN